MTHLTRTQVRVLIELARDGATNREIGQRLHLAEGTIKYHLGFIYEFAGCKRTRTALALWWEREGLRQHLDVMGSQ